MRYEVIAAIRDTNLSSMEKLFLMTVESRNNEKNEGYFGTRDKLMRDTGMAQPTIYKIRKMLKDKNVLNFVEQGYGKPSVYKVLADDLALYKVSTTENLSTTEKDSTEEKDVSTTENNVSTRENNVSTTLCTKDNVKKNIEEEQEEQLSIYKNIVKEEVLALSEKSGVPTDLLNSESSSSSVTSSNERSVREPVRNEPVIEIDENEEFLKRIEEEHRLSLLNKKKIEEANQRSLERVLAQPWEQVVERGIKDRDSFIAEFDSLNTELIDSLNEKHIYNLVPVIDKYWKDYNEQKEPVVVAEQNQNDWENASW